MHAMVCNRPVKAQAMSMMSRYMGNMRKRNWDIVKWFLNDLKGTLDVCLKFRINKIRLIGYCDSGDARVFDGRMSTSGFSIHFGWYEN